MLCDFRVAAHIPPQPGRRGARERSDAPGGRERDGREPSDERGGSGPAEPASEHNTIPMSAAAERPGTPGSHKLNLCKPCSSGSSSSGKSDPSSRV
eukprot:CAMPEP_0181250072 /NCGR_PEP_ID=MMETSP1096-20121128/46116_1 /TAXON_ID=156174 ORGANISM="Chrysochromulina ericina, Strain CCMP281" /NCGR_SAMPLE_ID=MMETSP1096 /ASSEMBLY_ACC=CAM_ASM_000453 /LENGTH=95 /DNA_ID=CAMNT_0023347499 /DNA_START=46 /DNA_END=333 /DNA_ORIENTATION=+